MTYQILLHPKAAQFLTKTQKQLRNRLKKALKELETSPEKKGKQIKPSHFWKLRTGNYRAIYEIDKENRKVIILNIGHRKNIYDDFSRLT